MKSKAKNKERIIRDADEEILNSTNGYIPISVFMSPRMQLHFNDLHQLAFTFMQLFVNNTITLARGKENFVDFLKRCVTVTISEMELPVEAEVYIQEHSSIRVELNPLPFIASQIPSILRH